MSFTLIIIIITVITSFAAWNNPALESKWIFNPYLVLTKKQYYRFLTSGFIHQGYIHLGFNMFALYFFGRVIEQIYGYYLGVNGSWYFLILYLLGIVISDIPTFFKHREHPGYNALGASGGVAAVVFSSILFLPLNDICIYGIFCLPGFILGVLYLIYSYYQGKNMSDNINHDAHLFGALFGLIYSFFIYPDVLRLFFDQIISFRIF